MKTILSTGFVMLFALMTFAQNFEGTIKWTMKMEITDPAMKAKMADAQKKMNDPANQAKMKEMQDKMNDPQMKALMESNPQMKAQIESALKMAQGGASPADMTPQGFTIKLKGDNTLTKIEGGPMAMEVLYLKDKDQSYTLDRQAKTYSILGARGTKSDEQGNMKPKVTKTKETMKILNYTCTKYIVEATEGNRKMNQSIWATTEIKNINASNLLKHRMGRGESIFYEGIEGIPMRVESILPEGSMVMEMSEIKNEKLNASDFAIPTDFKETKSSYGR